MLEYSGHPMGTGTWMPPILALSTWRSTSGQPAIRPLLANGSKKIFFYLFILGNQNPLPLLFFEDTIQQFCAGSGGRTIVDLLCLPTGIWTKKLVCCRVAMCSKPIADYTIIVEFSPAAWLVWQKIKKDEKKETEDPTKGGIVCLDLPQSLPVWQVIKSGKASVHCIPSRSSIFRIIW